jgi:hypothetical protein
MGPLLAFLSRRIVARSIWVQTIEARSWTLDHRNSGESFIRAGMSEGTIMMKEELILLRVQG